MFHNKQILVGLYDSSSPKDAELTGFSIITTSGNILIDWGDGTSQFIDSNTLVNHTFYCSDYSSSLSNFWDNINPCI
jgi:hypothetical protein